MQRSNIAWTDWTWGVTHGCSKVSAGCENCYAETLSHRWNHTEHPWDNEHAAENVSTKPGKLEEPYALDEPAMVFVNSMSDLFHSEISDSFIEDVFAVMRNCPHLVFQILTKRPGRAAHMTLQWPENVWLGTSVEDSRVTERIAMLADTDAAVRFVSFEPLIGPVGDVDLSAIDWAIVGGESGSERRPMEHAWAADLFEQCRDQDTLFFFKQSSGLRPGTNPYLTIENELTGLREQREIQEVPTPHSMVQRARSQRRRAE